MVFSCILFKLIKIFWTMAPYDHCRMRIYLSLVYNKYKLEVGPVECFE